MKKKTEVRKHIRRKGKKIIPVRKHKRKLSTVHLISKSRKGQRVATITKNDRKIFNYISDPDNLKVEYGGAMDFTKKGRLERYLVAQGHEYSVDIPADFEVVWHTHPDKEQSPPSWQDVMNLINDKRQQVELIFADGRAFSFSKTPKVLEMVKKLGKEQTVQLIYETIDKVKTEDEAEKELTKLGFGVKRFKKSTKPIQLRIVPVDSDEDKKRKNRGARIPMPYLEKKGIKIEGDKKFKSTMQRQISKQPELIKYFKGVTFVELPTEGQDIGLFNTELKKGPFRLKSGVKRAILSVPLPTKTYKKALISVDELFDSFPVLHEKRIKIKTRPEIYEYWGQKKYHVGKKGKGGTMQKRAKLKDVEELNLPRTLRHEASHAKDFSKHPVKTASERREKWEIYRKMDKIQPSDDRRHQIYLMLPQELRARRFAKEPKERDISKGVSIQKREEAFRRLFDEKED